MVDVSRGVAPAENDRERAEKQEAARARSFDSATSPNTFWVPLVDLEFSEGAPVKKLTIAGGNVFAGNPASAFEPAEAFAFMPAA